MQDRRYHYLVRIIYRPRILIYGLAVTITASQFLYGKLSAPVILFCLFLALYPHIAVRVTGSLFKGAAPARYSLLIDGVLVAGLIVANDFHMMASVSFFTALVISTQIVAGMAVLLANAAIVLTVAFLGMSWSGFSAYDARQPLTDLLSALSLFLYSGLVGRIGFTETAALISSRAMMNEEQNRLESMTSRLRRYISPQIYSSLAQTDADAPDKTRRKRLTVFFSDIEGFTRLMDRLDEETVTRLLNEYLDDMTAIALAHGGTVDKFMGDGVMIFFGDPVSRGARQDALACVRMAIAMRERLTLLRNRWHGDLHLRIGVHTGYCAVGNFGSEDRMDYTIIGGAVNLASRLEGQAGRDEILISGDTQALIRDEITCMPKPPIRVRGIARSVSVYSVASVAAEGDQEGVPAVIRPRGEGRRALRG